VAPSLKSDSYRCISSNDTNKNIKQVLAHCWQGNKPSECKQDAQFIISGDKIGSSVRLSLYCNSLYHDVDKNFG